MRERPGAAWRFQLVIDDLDGGHWVYRRDARVRMPIGKLTWEAHGARHLAPEVQLLFKSKTLRPKDEQDFEETHPVLGAGRCAWLSDALSQVDPTHPWRARLSSA